ncbi:unnamed protein product [Closterium sp. NIES-53]
MSCMTVPLQIDVTEIAKTIEATTADLTERYLDTDKQFGGEGKCWLVGFLKLHGHGGCKKVRVRGVDGEGRPVNHLYTMHERKLPGHKVGSGYEECVKLCRSFARDCVDNLNERLDDLGKLGPTKLFRAGKWPKIKAQREKKCSEWLLGCSKLFRHQLPGFDLKAAERELPTFCAIMEAHHELESFTQGLTNILESADSKRYWPDVLEVWRSMRRRRPAKSVKLAVADRERRGKAKEGEVEAGAAHQNDGDEDEEEEVDVEQALGDDQELVGEEEDSPFLSDDEDVEEVFHIDRPGPAPSGVSQVDAVEPVEVAVDSGAATGAEPAGAGSGGAGSGGAETEGAEPGGAEPGGAASGGAETWGAEPGGAATGGTESGGAEPGVTEPGGAEPGGAGSARVASRSASWWREVLSPQELRECFARRWSRAAGAGGTTATTCPGGAGAAGPGGPAEAAGVGPTGGSVGASGGTGAAVSAGPGAAGALGVGAAGGAGAGGSADAGTSEGVGAGAAGAGGTTGTGASAGSPGAVHAGSGGAPRPRPYFVPLLEQVLGLPPSPGPAPPFECPQPVQSQSLLQPVSPLPAPSPYAGPTGGLAERRAPASRPASPACPACTSRRASRPCPPASDSLHAASPTVACFLATVVTDPSLASIVASALVAELVDFAARCRLDYTASLVAESASVCPPSVGGECALSTDVLEDRQEEFQCFAAALPHLVSTLLAPEGDPDAPDIPTPRSYAEAIEGPGTIPV